MVCCLREVDKMTDTQVYAPPCEVFKGSKLRTMVVVFPSTTGWLGTMEESEPVTSFPSGPSHFTEEGESEVTAQDRE